MPEEIRPIVRNYTARQHRQEVVEIDVDFVLHGDGGPASQLGAAGAAGRSPRDLGTAHGVCAACGD